MSKSKFTHAQHAQLPFKQGPLNAKIVLVGEAPGGEEAIDKEKRPFIGSSGKLLRELLQKFGVNPEECYITNILKTRPPKNDFAKFVKENPKTFETHIKLLRFELELLEDPYLIVPVGKQALRILCGKTSIEKWRGSRIKCIFPPIKNVKAFPILHPAAVLRAWKKYFTPFVADIKKLKEESSFKELILPEREFIIRPTFEQVLEYIDLCKNKKPTSCIGLDIETTLKKICSIQLAISKKSAITIPFQYKSGESYFPLDQEIIIWQALTDLLENCGRRILGQNIVAFDFFYLAIHGFNHKKLCENLLMDTMTAMQCLEPELPRGLDFLCSIWTKEPYYKDEGKEWGTRVGEEEFWTYGAKDVAVLHEIAEKLKKELEEADLWEFYKKRFLKQAFIQLDLSLRGLPFDSKKREKLEEKFTKEIIKKQAQLNVIVNKPLNVKSPKQMVEFLYQDLKLPIKRNRAGNPSADKYIVNEYAAKHNIKALKLAAEISEKRTLFGNNIRVSVDSDNKIRTSYGFTETGRWRSSKTPLNTGTNLQNWTHEMRVMIHVPPDEWFLEVDGAQAEARIVGYRARDVDGLIRIFESNKDIHCQTGSIIFGLPPAEIVGNEPGDTRYLAKRIVHASNYGMGPALFAKVYNLDAAKFGKPMVTSKQAKIWQQKYHEGFPNIKNVFQQELAEEVKKYRKLYNPFGRRMVFRDRVGYEMYKAAFAWYPQSTVADWTNTILMKLYNSHLAKVVHQMHDGITMTIKPKDLDKAIEYIKECANFKIPVQNYKVYIPIEFKIGKENWRDMEEIAI